MPSFWCGHANGDDKARLEIFNNFMTMVSCTSDLKNKIADAFNESEKKTEGIQSENFRVDNAPPCEVGVYSFHIPGRGRMTVFHVLQ